MLASRSNFTDDSSMYGMGMLAIGGVIGDWPEELENPKALTCCCDTPRKTRNVLGRRNIVVSTWMMMLKDWLGPIGSGGGALRSSTASYR